jgi:hypothetical protein
VFKDDGSFVTGDEKIDNFVINENGKPYIKTLMVDFKLWADQTTPTTLHYLTGGGFELRGHTLHFNVEMLVDIMGNYGYFSIGITDPDSHDSIHYSPNSKGEVVAKFYRLGDLQEKPSSTSTLKWTDALPGGY